MNYVELIEIYAGSLGIEDIEIENDGAVFEIADFVVVVKHDPASERVTLVADAGEIAAERRAEVAETLLQLNFATALNGGMTIAASPDTGKYYCLNSLPLTGLDVNRFGKEMLNLVAKARVARELIGLEADLAAIPAAAPAPAGDLLFRA